MKVTYNWLKDFVNIKISPEALAHKLTMAGIEVKTCEEKEGDFVFEIEITSNRPDWLSVIGIAREVAAITGAKLKIPNPKLSTASSLPKQNLHIIIENKKDCPLYSAKIIKNIKVGPSPAWLKKRLELIGCRSINNIVDITNYVLFECGEPLHAFDLDRLNSDTIVVRRARNGEKFIAIDEEKRILSTDILVIADKEKPVAIAGIMGGKDSEVSENTRNVLLEAAVFNPVLIRRGRQKLAMQTDSSYRFERGLDYESAEFASRRATELIAEIAGGRCVLDKSSGSTKAKTINIDLNIPSASRVLGVDIAATKIKQILAALGFQVRLESKNNFKVKVPLYRQDVDVEIDLVEEIARVFGYENIPLTLPAVQPHLSAQTPKDLIPLLKNILVGLGLNEVITYSLIDRNLLDYLGQPEGQLVEILNPLSQEQEILRPTLLAGLARCIARNLNQKQPCVNIFEVAHTFSLVNNHPKEEAILGIALCGTKSWLTEQGLVKEKVGFLHLKGIIEALFERLGIQDYSFKLSPDASSAEIDIGRQKAGLLIKLKKEALNLLDIKNEEVLAAELSLDKVFSAANLKKRLRALPVYPGIVRDTSIIVKEEVPAEEILGAIRAKAGDLLQEVRVADYYRGKHIPVGFKGLTISCLYRAPERTLTEAEVNPIHSLVLSLLSEDFRAQIR